jgi:hypothetical protein
LVWNVHAHLTKAAAESIKLDAKEWSAGWRAEGIVDVGLIEKPLLAGGKPVILLQAYQLGEWQRWYLFRSWSIQGQWRAA